MKYMLDTNTCIFLMKNNSIVVNHYKQKRNDGIAISAIVASELYYGVYNSSNPIKNEINLMNFFIGVSILDFNSSAAIEFGIIRATLRKQGTPIGLLDMLIAGHARALNMVLVTNNTNEFARVQGLQIQDWLIE